MFICAAINFNLFYHQVDRRELVVARLPVSFSFVMKARPDDGLCETSNPPLFIAGGWRQQIDVVLSSLRITICGKDFHFWKHMRKNCIRNWKKHVQRFKWIKSDYYVQNIILVWLVVCFKCSVLILFTHFFPTASGHFSKHWRDTSISKCIAWYICVACCVNVIYSNRSGSDALTSHAHAHIHKMTFECLICRMVENKYWSSQSTNNRNSVRACVCVCVSQTK